MNHRDKKLCRLFLLLTVIDNDVGFPENVDFRNTQTSGLRLVTMLAESQLNGQIKFNTSEGTKFQVIFKKTK